MKLLSKTFLLFIINLSICAKPFLVCYEDTNFFPYNANGDQNQVLTPVIKTISEAVSNIGFKADFIRTSWSRCLKDIKDNKVDALLTSLWSKKREEIAVFPKKNPDQADSEYRILQADYKVYTLKNSSLEWDGKTFSGVKQGIGAPKNYIAAKMLQEMKLLKETNLKVKQSFELMLKGRLDAYIVLEEVGEITLKDFKERDSIKTLDKNFLTDYLYIPVSHKFNNEYPEKTQQFFKELAKAREKYMPNGLL